MSSFLTLRSKPIVFDESSDPGSSYPCTDCYGGGSYYETVYNAHPHELTVINNDFSNFSFYITPDNFTPNPADDTPYMRVMLFDTAEEIHYLDGAYGNGLLQSVYIYDNYDQVRSPASLFSSENMAAAKSIYFRSYGVWYPSPRQIPFTLHYTGLLSWFWRDTKLVQETPA